MIYLDNAAATKVFDEVGGILDVYYKEKYFNPSALYEGAVSVGKDILNARKTIADCLGCSGDEIIFTSGGSESDNTAIFGAVKNKKGRIITSLGEHMAVYSPFNELKNRGYDVHFVGLRSDGSIDFDKYLSLLNKDTVFVSIIHASNETGAVNDIKKIAGFAKSANPACIVHSDGVQAFMKMPVNVRQLNVDLYSVSGHKIHCPKGIGALYIKKGVRLNPLIYGASQEYGLRAGTENAGLICALAQVCKIMQSSIAERTKIYKELKGAFLGILDEIGEDYVINGAETCLDNILSISFSGIKSDILIQMMSDKNIYLGSGSACSSRQKVSRVLKECGLPQKYLEGSVRISFSHFNTKEEAEFAAKELCGCVKTLRGLIRR
jgi:cysteine desulfurase